MSDAPAAPAAPEVPTPAPSAVGTALAAAGLLPVPAEDPETAPAVAVLPTAPVAPVASVPAPAPTAPPPVAPPTPPASPVAPALEPEEDEIVVPEGAANPDAVRNAIKAERKAAREANARARELEAQLAAKNDEQIPLEQKVANANAATAAAERKALTYEVVAAVGLDLAWAPRLAGSTREEMMADAQVLKASVTAATPPAPPPALPPEGGVRTTPPAKPDPVKDHNNTLLAILHGTAGGRGLEPAPED
jgi:hypothetical protein